METSVVDVATVADDTTAMWVPFPGAPKSYLATFNPKLGGSYAREFSTRAQVDEVLKRLKDNGYGVDKLVVRDQGGDYSEPPYRRLVYLTPADGPRLYAITGTVTTPDGTEATIYQGDGFFINEVRLNLKGQMDSQPPGVTFGDKVGVAFYNPFWASLVWTA